MNASDLSRRDTTLRKASYLGQLPLSARPGSAAWVRHGLQLRVAESRRDRNLVAGLVKRFHYLARWPCPPKTLILSYLGALAGCDEVGAASMVMVALLPGQYHVLKALDVGQLEVLVLVRMWRADDLGPAVAPNLTPETLRRVVRGERGRGPLLDLRSEWIVRKCRPDGLRVAPRLLVTYADPGMGHDGATYTAAGATYCGPAVNGKLLFAWALDQDLRAPLAALGRAVSEREP